MEWDPKLVGLLVNVLSCRLKEDIPTKVGGVRKTRMHESQSPEAVDDDTKTGVTVLEMEAMRVKAHLIRNSASIASWRQTREDILEITRTQQYTDSNPVPMQIGAHLKSKGKGKDSRDKGNSKGKDTKNESSKKVKADDKKRCCCCQETGHVWSQCGSRLKDLADAEEEPVTANSHPNDTAAVVLLLCSPPGKHAMTFHMAMPCVERKTPGDDVNDKTMTRPDAGSTVPTGTERVQFTHVIPTCETCLMMDACAGGGICPRGSDQTAHNDTTVATIQLVTAPG